MATDQEHRIQQRRPWLMAAIFAFVLFLGNIAIEVLGEELKEILKPYGFWLWLVLITALLVTIVGAVREAKTSREPRAASSGSAHSTGARSVVTAGNIEGSNLFTVNNNSVDRVESGNASSKVKVTIKNYPSPETSDKTVDSRSDDGSVVNWEDRDNALLREFLAMCAEYDTVYLEHERWQDRAVREHLVTGGLAIKGPDGETYLTRDGVLLCCQKGKIPQRPSTWMSDSNR